MEVEDAERAAKVAIITFRRLLDYYEPDEADAWLNSVHPQLSGMTPIGLIASGLGGVVDEVIDRLDSDGYL